MRATALVITAPTLRWAEQAALAATGFATSIIGCGVEAGIDADLAPDETPDGRPGRARAAVRRARPRNCRSNCWPASASAC